MTWWRCPFFVVASAGTLLLVFVSFVVAPAESTYRWAFLFLAPILWLVRAFRYRLALLPAHYGIFTLAILIHGLGAFGSYQRTFAGLRFDTYVHFGFGLAAGLILHRALREKQKLSFTALWIAVPLFVLGGGALHELFECFTTLLLGPERGMLKLRPNEPFDTHKDLLNNLLGALFATAASSLRTRSSH